MRFAYGVYAECTQVCAMIAEGRWERMAEMEFTVVSVGGQKGAAGLQEFVSVQLEAPRGWRALEDAYGRPTSIYLPVSLADAKSFWVGQKVTVTIAPTPRDDA